MEGYTRVIISGTSPAPGEVWSVGLNLNNAMVDTSLGAHQAAATAVAARLGGLTTGTLAQFLSTSGAITRARVESRSADSTLLQAAESTEDLPQAGTGTASKVLQCAAVISLLTARPGRSYRGRVYWPAWNWTGTSAMLFSNTDMVNLGSAWGSLAAGIRADVVAADDDADPHALVVWSYKLQTGEPITRYGTGNVPDTQRRRRDGVDETYVYTAAT